MADEHGDPTAGATRVMTRRSAPWPLGFVGMLGLLLVIEWTLNGHDLDFTAPWHWDWRTTGTLTSKKQAKADILLFGDSLMKFGVMPKVLADRSGRTAYNFALHTGQTSSSYFMLRRVLKAGNHPKAIVLDLTTHMFNHLPEYNVRLWPELLTPAECFDLGWSMGNLNFGTATLLARLVPSIKERHDIRVSLVDALAGKPTSSWRYRIPMFRRNWKKNDGGQLMPDGPSPPIDPVQWERSLYPAWTPSPVNVAYLNRFLKLAQAADVPVFWLLPPAQPALQARTEASGYDAAYTGFVRQVAGRFPGVTVVDARHSGFEPSEFNDGVHLTRYGALRLSAALGALLRGDLSGGRWVNLDAGLPRSVEFPIEDVNQSAVALQSDQSRVQR